MEVTSNYTVVNINQLPARDVLSYNGAVMSRAAYWDNFFQVILLPCNNDLTACSVACVLFRVRVANLLII